MSKDGRKFFYLSTSFFFDRKTKILNARFGAEGVEVYLYLLCEIYREEGYFIRSDDDLIFIIASDLAIDCEKVSQFITFMVEHGMFDKGLFDSEGILTSQEVQLTFQEAVKGKAVKNPVVVDERLWLLEKSETKAYMKWRGDGDSSRNGDADSGNFDEDSENFDTKQSKAKKNKAKESKAKSSLRTSSENPDHADGDSAAAAAARSDEIDDAYSAATGKHLTSTERSMIASLHGEGVSDELIVSVIRDIGCRHNCRINSFRYFLPAIREAASEVKTRYPPTCDSADIEAILDAEWMAEFPDSDEEYIYDD